MFIANLLQYVEFCNNLLAAFRQYPFYGRAHGFVGTVSTAHPAARSAFTFF